MPTRIIVTGLKEFRQALKAADVELPREMRKVFNIAAQAVVADAVPKMPERSGKLKGSVRALSTQTEGRVVSGTARVPYAGFIEFGGRVGKGRTGPRTGSVVRSFVAGGRYLYPAYLRKRPEIIVATERGLSSLVDRIEGK